MVLTHPLELPEVQKSIMYDIMFINRERKCSTEACESRDEVLLSFPNERISI